MKIKILVGIVSVILFTGCVKQNNTTVAKQGEPKWLLDPYFAGDKVAAVGCAMQHFNGEQAQKKLAIARAIDQIATQNKVTVDNVTLRNRQASNFGSSSSMKSASAHKVDNVSVSTKTKAIYKKPNGEICAWVVQR